MYSSPRPQCERMPHRLLWVPVGTNKAASKPSRSAIFSCSALVLGSVPNTSSPNGAAIMAARIAAVGCVTVSLRKSTAWGVVMWDLLVEEVLQHGVAMLGEDGFGMELHAFDAHVVRKA